MSEAISLKEQLTEAMKAAMKAGDKQRLGVLRLVLAAIKQREVDERITLDDPQVLGILDKMVKQRLDSVTQYESAGRDDLAAQENYEITVIKEYMPSPLSEDEIEALISEAVSETGAASVRDMGKVMNSLRSRIQGRADIASVSARVKQRLG